jgi:hypothetical protein
MSSGRSKCSVRLARTLVAVIALILAVSGAALAAFTDIGAGLPGVSGGCVAWGDYDNDGDLDLVLSGSEQYSSLAKIYRNTGGSFADAGAGLAPATFVTLGDYDTDGDLDLAFASSNIRLCRNDNGQFLGIDTNALGPHTLAWGDYDNDGDLDLATSGYAGYPGPISKVYRNDGGTLVDTHAAIRGVYDSSMAWGDYDNDGDLDLAILGYTGTVSITKLYRNDSGVLVDSGANLISLRDGCIAWGDYDNDGDLDLALSGYCADTLHDVTTIYTNNSGAFAGISERLPGVEYGSLAWGDYDNDGDLDLVVSGYGYYGSDQELRTYYCSIYENAAGSFRDAGANLTGVRYSSVAWGDYDNDGDLDLAVAGETIHGYISTIYRNDGTPPNAPPSSPTGLSASVSGNGDITFSWEAASDDHTPSNGLSYNLRVGTTPGGNDVFSGMASLDSGFRRLPCIGNAQKKLCWTLKGLCLRTCYWSVQSIDTSFAGSAWAPENVFSADAYLISGRVRSISGAGIPSATVAVSGGPAIVTGKDGCYKVWTSAGWSGTISVSKPDYRFANSSRQFTSVSSDLVEQDYVSTEGFARIDNALPGFQSGSLAWGDYDGDGRLDAAITGLSSSGGGTSQVYTAMVVVYLQTYSQSCVASATPALGGRTMTMMGTSIWRQRASP